MKDGQARGSRVRSIIRGIVDVLAVAVVAFLPVACNPPLNTQSTTQCILTVLSDGNGTTSPSGWRTVNEGFATSISATPTANYGFVNWKVTSGTASIANPGSAFTMVTLNNGNATVCANFAAASAGIPATPTGLAAGNPTASSLSITWDRVTAASSYELFRADSVDGPFTSPVYTGSNNGFEDGGLAANTTYYYEVRATNGAGSSPLSASASGTTTSSTSTHILTVQNDGHGSTNPSTPTTVASGVSTPVSAMANSGYYFDHWSIISGSPMIADTSAASTTVMLNNGDGTVKANFAVDQPVHYTLTVQNDGHGGTNPSGQVTVNVGAATSITASAYSSYRFDHWSVVSGSPTISSAGSASTTVTLTTGSAAIKANFAVNQYTLTLQTDGYGSTNPSGQVTMNVGTPTSIAATPYSGYRFDHWSIISGSPTIANTGAASTMVTLNSGSAIVKASFALIPVITVTSPNGGESWSLGRQYTITWSANAAVGSFVTIGLYRNGAYYQAIANSAANVGYYYWTIPSGIGVSSHCQICVTDATNSTVWDFSNSNFSIGGIVTLSTPNGGYATDTGWAYIVADMLAGFKDSPWPLNNYSSRAFAWFSIPSDVQQHTIVSATLKVNVKDISAWNGLLSYVQVMSLGTMTWSYFSTLPIIQDYGVLVGNQENYAWKAATLAFSISPATLSQKEEMGFAILAVPEILTDSINDDTNQITLNNPTLEIQYRE